MKKLGLLSLSVLFVAACNPVKGTLSVKKALKLSIPVDNSCNEEIDWWNCNSSPENLLLQPGQYSLNLIFKAKDKVDLEVKVEKNKIKTIPLALNGQRFPEYAGAVHVKATEIKQEFDIEGMVDSQVSDSQTYSDRESCSELVRRRVCHRVHEEANLQAQRGEKDGKDRGANRGGERKPPGRDDGRKPGGDRDNHRDHHRDREVCEWKYVTEYGSQDVEYFYRTTHTTVDLNFLKPHTQNLLASYSGDRSESDKIYTYKGTCFIRY